MGLNKRYDIAIVGAGMSGLCAAIQLKKQLGITDVTIYEKNIDVGGTWLNNTYPGCASDICSHLYSFSFELNPFWTSNFPSQPELLDYLKNVTNKHKIYEHIKFQHEVTVVSWNETLCKWIVKFVNLSTPNAEEETKTFDILINAPGVVRVPLIPNEFKSFTGPTMHTAEWNHEIEIKNKKVAVIGTGASAIQVIPSIIDTVDTLHCYQRKPPFILERRSYPFSSYIKNMFFYFPFIMWLYRCFIFLFNELIYKAFVPGTFWNKTAIKWAQKYRQDQLKDHKHMWDDMAPKYGFGCKRVLVSDDYYSAIAHPNIRLHTSHIEKVVNQTIYTKDGLKEEIDVLILATGFRVHDYFAPMQVYGKDGVDIRKEWTDKWPESYYGIVYSNLPNFFVLLGPNTGLGHNSAVFMIECQVDYLVKAIQEMANRNAKFINVKTSAVDAFMEKVKCDLSSTIWGKENCGSWYGNSRGEITILWGENCISYWRETRNPDWSKFDFI